MTNKTTSSKLRDFFHDDSTNADTTKSMHDSLLKNIDDADVQQAISDLWQSCSNAEPDCEATDLAFQRVQQRISKRKFNALRLPATWRKTLRIAASWLIPLLAASAIALLAIDNTNLRQQLDEPITYADYYAPMGTTKLFTLPDSSKVWLHGGSTLVVASNFNKSERRVHLTGEGFFKVTHNEDKRFIVSTDHLEMHVLGTEFNISSYPEEESIVTTLEKGRLKVLNTLNNKSLILKPGDQVAFNSTNGQFELAHVDASEFSSWRYGYIFFNDIKMNELLQRLERHYNVRFVGPQNAGFLNQRVRARFNQDEKLGNILSILNMIVPEFHYTMKSDTIYYN